jgi:hypothetical protein
MTAAFRPPRCEESGLIRAELIGSSECRAAGIVVRSTSPILGMCRRLLAAGISPDLRLDCYRGATLAISVCTIRRGAALEVNGEGTGFRPFRGPGAASLVGSPALGDAEGSP